VLALILTSSLRPLCISVGAALVFCCGSDCVVLLWKGLFCFAVGQPLVIAVAAAPSLAVDTLHPTASSLLWISWLPWVISGCRCPGVTASSVLLTLIAVGAALP
jgi:hypothetical protein